MESIVVSELHRYARDELGEMLGLHGDALTTCLRLLRECGIMKVVTADSTQKSRTDLNFDEELSAPAENLGDTVFYVFNFVGVILINGTVIKCLPKYLSNTAEADEQLQLILRVIRRYGARQQDTGTFRGLGTRDHENLLALMVHMLEDYYDHGIYTNTIDMLETNGRGEIDWSRTINEGFPVINAGRPYYLEFYTRRRQSDEGDFFRRLHESLLSQFSSQLREAGLLAIFGIPSVHLSEVSLDSLGGADYILYRIESELSVEFNTRKLLVLEAMFSYFTTFYSLDLGGLTLYGTSSFNLVWEKVCASVLDDQLMTPLRNLPFNVSLDEEADSTANLRSVIERPKWTRSDSLGDFTKEAPSTLVPDVVSFDTEGPVRRMLIFDAKYYVMEMTRDRALSGQPGIGDIAKQYLYQLAFKDFNSRNQIASVTNCFLLPTEGARVVDGGRVTFEILTGLGLSEIEVRLLPARTMYDLYLRRRTLKSSALSL